MFAGSRRLRRIQRNDCGGDVARFFEAFRRLLLQIGGANIAGADRAWNPATSSSLADDKACLLIPPQHAGARSDQHPNKAAYDPADRVYAECDKMSKASSQARGFLAVSQARNRANNDVREGQ